MALTFFSTLAVQPYTDIVGGKTISSSALPTISDRYDVTWSEFASGVGDHVRISNTDAATLLPASTPFTFGFWVEFDADNTHVEIANWFGVEDDRTFILQRLSNNTLRLFTYFIGGQSAEINIPNVRGARPLFVSFSWDGTDTVKLQAGSRIVTGGPPGSPFTLDHASSNLVLGFRVGTSNQHDGVIRSWIIWDEVLSDEDRINIYRSGLWAPVTCRAAARGYRSSRDTRRTVLNPGL